jgi:hypothetical protein
LHIIYNESMKKNEGERGLEGNGAAVCVGLGSALCQVVQGRCGGLSDLGLRGEVRDAGKQVAWFGVAAWDVTVTVYSAIYSIQPMQHPFVVFEPRSEGSSPSR